MKIKNKHKIIFALLVFGAVFLIGAYSALAEDIDPTTAIGGSVSGGVYTPPTGALTDGTADSVPGLLNLVLVISSGIMSLFGYLIDFSIAIGKSVMSLPIVQIGSQTMISFANLGFVFAIIVMAFATIFRVQSYAMKQTLWKLIVAALLVNFSLTIAGAFISVSNIFTDFFLQGLNGKSISDGLMGVLNPQALVEVNDASAWDILTGMLSYLFKYMASLLFVIVFNFIIILTFFALFIMLLIRAITLGVLLVIMPIVWLLWIFPGTSKYWSEWWNNFIRWTFFAPIVLFFIVLVISSGGQLQKIRETSGVSQQQGVGVEKAFKDSMTFNPDFFDHVSQIIITTGLLLGGLIAANKMGITFASTAMGLAKGSGKMFGGWVGRKSLQYGTGILNKPRGKEGEEKKSYTQRLSEWSAGSKLAKYTLLPGLAARGIAKFSAAGGENLVKQAKDGAGKRSLNENIAMLGYGSSPTQQGILEHLQEKNLLNKVPNVMKYIDKKHMDEFAKRGQAPAFGDIEKSLGMNVAMKENLDKGDAGREEFYKEGKKFFSKFSKIDWKKTQFNDIFSEKSSVGLSESSHKTVQEGVVHGIISNNPGDVVKILSNVKPQNFERARSVIKDSALRIKIADPDSKIPEAVERVLDRTLGKRLLGEGEYSEHPEYSGPTKAETKAENQKI